MIKILFVCHGNICRSPMAEFIMRDMCEKRGLTDIVTASAATSTEELGNGVHYGTRGVLNRLGIDCSAKRARQITRGDYDEYDLLIGMDSANIRNMTRYWGDKMQQDAAAAARKSAHGCAAAEGNRRHKIHKLLDFTERKNGDVADPWYTGNFERTYLDVKEGCEGLIETILRGDFGDIKE
ncbi:MAG: low molecular weight phosphotyrosine protein phosphatase [Lachnospiraceae bacterium]|nr:low molecular weight phosphotyrosine protein phosphatase [Ruminococcus sp.]MCM1276456.1 low molecular weight phosphotyrosine protein phosphatase [Lachnospiraceae bacterium]